MMPDDRSGIAGCRQRIGFDTRFCDRWFGIGDSPHYGGQIWRFLYFECGYCGSRCTLYSTTSYEANRASILGGYERRFDDWKLQERLAKKEIAQVEKQIAAAELRRDI